MEYHEYLQEDSHYESSTVHSGRTNKYCEHCGAVILKGNKHRVHKFYGEDGGWPTYPVHLDCNDAFMESLRPNGYEDPVVEVEPDYPPDVPKSNDNTSSIKIELK